MDKLRSPNDRETALECLKLAAANITAPAADLVADAAVFFEFVTGDDRARALSELKDAVDALK